MIADLAAFLAHWHQHHRNAPPLKGSQSQVTGSSSRERGPLKIGRTHLPAPPWGNRWKTRRAHRSKFGIPNGAARPHHQPRRRCWEPPQNFTALTSPISTILRDHRALLPPPRRGRGPIGGRRDQHCVYHRAVGHATDECFDLKETIEDLIQRGKLAHFVRHPGQPKQNQASSQSQVMDSIVWARIELSPRGVDRPTEWALTQQRHGPSQSET